MANSATTTDLQRCALLLYHWYCSESEVSGDAHLIDFALINRVLPMPFSLEQFKLLSKKMRNHKDFSQQQELIHNQWHQEMERGPSEAAANDFINQLMTQADSRLFFDHSIICGTTLKRKGELGDTAVHRSDMGCWRLHLTTQGRGIYQHGNTEIECKAGDLVLFKPHADIVSQRHQASPSWEHRWLLFQPQQHWQAILDWPQVGDGIYHIHIDKRADIKQAADFLEQINNTQLPTEPLNLQYQYTLLEQLLIRARCLLAETEVVKSDERIEQACLYMKQHITQKFAVADVATHCNVSPSRLAHLFKEKTGSSLKNWANDLRLQTAREQLLESNSSISSIAASIGYADQAQLAKAFKKNFGCSPSEFRKSFSG